MTPGPDHLMTLTLCASGVMPAEAQGGAFAVMAEALARAAQCPSVASGALDQAGNVFIHTLPFGGTIEITVKRESLRRMEHNE